VGWTPEPPHPPTNAGWMLVGLPWAAARAGVALIHAPAYTAPFVAGVPVVLTIHDVSYERHPEWFPYRRDRIRRVFYRRSARGAAHILTDSAFSAAEIQAAYGIPPRRMTVAPLGVDPSFTPLAPGAACELPEGVRAPFLLHVGDLHERRNLVTVIEALAAARRHFGVAAGLSLVLAGIDRGVGGGLRQLAARLGLADALVLLGATSELRLRDLYRCASALVYPSLYEGFGFPLLEAMASGLPVIASHAASMPEVVGDAGILIPPLDSAAWEDAIVRVVNDDDRRAAMRAAGLRRASTFTWARTADMTLRVYRDALGEAR
jgi:glycosyltransferase involved in cell wall biosynthesis